MSEVKRNENIVKAEIETADKQKVRKRISAYAFHLKSNKKEGEK